MTTTLSAPETAEDPLDRSAEAQLDEAAAEAFAGRLVGILNSASLAILTSIGHQTGLFETLDALPPSTSQQIADAAGFNERYVREWLGGQTTADVVRYNPTDSTYWLPREHAAFLTPAAGPDNLARVMQYIAMMGEVEQEIIGCFRNGGGLPYSAYPRFHQVQGAESAALYDAALVDVIVPLVPGLTERLQAGIDVADIGCGRGHAINVLAAAFPASRFTGFDLSEEAIGEARSQARRLGVSNTHFEVCDVTTLPEDARFDVVTAFDAIHDQAHPAAVLANIVRALRPGGVFLMQDIKASSKVEENSELPWAALLYTISTTHCMSVSLGLGGDGLGTVWGEQLAVSMLKAAGFPTVEVREIEADPFNNYYVAQKA